MYNLKYNYNVISPMGGGIKETTTTTTSYYAHYLWIELGRENTKNYRQWSWWRKHSIHKTATRLAARLICQQEPCFRGQNYAKQPSLRWWRVLPLLTLPTAWPSDPGADLLKHVTWSAPGPKHLMHIQLLVVLPKCCNVCTVHRSTL